MTEKSMAKPDGIDDDLDTLRLVGLMLQRQGYQISAATNGQQGLEKAFGRSGRGDRLCALGSVKSQIGHTKAAAGAAGLIKATLALLEEVGSVMTQKPPSRSLNSSIPTASPSIPGKDSISSC